ncbi:hypothetical protein MPTK1_7g17970 [Marchantia polymorpha subsp. ruderalis]|uniref:Uncharacterized protein n=2 Tax=Marchantia polymorpha TaxID=3197 RepID=A0AAF6C0X8_MARPO|nr:hypothetical protein MARPO_0102s0043 [Marchantia polymorpha]BBN17912.1 hypothetical protein Mp_7g17970 [Marchantia polymorpha subsp. ruderalis]|eukprot:PTQ32178.1 hypothetical protein MARPO_0102s0043 [Marchantia polymorpha]
MAARVSGPSKRGPIVAYRGQPGRGTKMTKCITVTDLDLRLPIFVDLSLTRLDSPPRDFTLHRYRVTKCVSKNRVENCNI